MKQEPAMSNDYDKETFDTWNRIAEVYEDKFMDLEIYNSSYDRFLELLQGDEVLDLGCGPGNIARYLTQHRSKLNIFGWDIAPNMVNLARKHVPGGLFEVRDIRAISETDMELDGIICGFGLPYVSQSELHAFITGLSKKLKKGGVLYLSYVAGNSLSSGYKAGSEGNRVYFHYHDHTILLNELANAGFAAVEEYEVSYVRGESSSEPHTIVLARKFD